MACHITLKTKAASYGGEFSAMAGTQVWNGATAKSTAKPEISRIVAWFVKDASSGLAALAEDGNPGCCLPNGLFTRYRCLSAAD